MAHFNWTQRDAPPPRGGPVSAPAPLASARPRLGRARHLHTYFDRNVQREQVSYHRVTASARHSPGEIKR